MTGELRTRSQVATPVHRKGGLSGAATLKNRSLVGTRLSPQEIEHTIVRVLPKLDVPVVAAIIRPRTVIPSVVASAPARPPQVAPPRPVIKTTVTAKPTPRGRVVRGEE